MGRGNFKAVLATLCILSAGTFHNAAAQTHALTGSVVIELHAGVITADLCLTDPPAQNDTVRFLLNRGFNIKRIRSDSGAVVSYDSGSDTNDDIKYAVRHNGRICIEYVGAFPVYNVASGDYRDSDGSSVIAFNGMTLRARGETRWYPVPYDAANNQTQDELTYRIHVSCAECHYLYINGAAPHSGPEADLSSDVARELLIYSGNYPLQEIPDGRIIGETVTADTARMFFAQLREIEDFYADYLGVPYGPRPDILRIIPARKDRRGQFWGFFSDPALGLVGLTIGDFVHILADKSEPARPMVLGVLAHELGHRYFPHVLAPGGAYFQLFSEPFANYLDLKATLHFYGDSAYAARVHKLAEPLRAGADLPALDRVDTQTLASDAYRYHYAPLLLLSLERAIGEARMRRLMRLMLTAPASERANASYALIHTAALRAGVEQDVWKKWEEDCLRPAFSKNSCLATLASSGDR